jgi:hypothetical protein
MVRRLLFVVLLAGALTSLSFVLASGTGYVVVGQIEPPGMGGATTEDGSFRAVETRDGYIYVLYRGDLLLVFDGRELGSEADVAILDETVAEVPIEPGDRSGLLVVGDRLYCYGWRGGLTYDISNPAAPILVGGFGDEATHVFRIATNGALLAAACYDRLVIYALDLSIDYPTAIAEIELDPETFAYEVCIAGSCLWATGFRRRLSGENDYWMGAWDFSAPQNPSLLGVSPIEDRGFRLAAVDGTLVAVGEDRAELWDVSSGKPVAVASTFVCGRALAQDGAFLVLEGCTFTVRNGEIEVLAGFGCPMDSQHAGLLRLGAAAGDLVVLPRKRSILILARQSAEG